MTASRLVWLMMLLLSLVVAGYAATLLLRPELRPMFVDNLFAERPIATTAHFAGSALALAIGAFQTSSWLRGRSIGTHRGLGRLYVLGVALGGFSGLFMALHSSGGEVAQFGFGLLAVCWLGITSVAYHRIVRGDVAAHRRWMIRSFALTFGAVTLRIYLPVSQFGGVPLEVAYPAVSWLAWVPNLVVAELFIRLARSPENHGRSFASVVD